MIIILAALGLSIVHINRTLKQLRREGAIRLKAGSVTLVNRARLMVLAFYQSTRDTSEGRLRDLVA